MIHTTRILNDRAKWRRDNMELGMEESDVSEEEEQEE